MFEQELNNMKMLDDLWFAQQEIDREVYIWLMNDRHFNN